MADRTISALTALTTPAAGDYLPIVDISEAGASSKNKRITIEELFRGVPDGTAAAPSISFENDPNTGFYRPTADTIAFVEGGAEVFRIDSTARVLVGTTSSRGLTLNNAARMQLEGDNNNNSTFSITHTANAASGQAANIKFARVRGSNTIVSEGDVLGSMSFIGYDGGAFQFGAYIYSIVDGAPGAGSMPARLSFYTTSSGSVAPTERLRIDSSGRVGIGTSAPAELLEVNQAANADGGIYIRARGGNTKKAHLFFLTLASTGGTRGGTIFHDGNGLAFNNVTNTTSEVFRITTEGVLAYNQPAPVAVNTTATLTIANLKAGIITSTTAAAVTMTLPTGTLSEAGFGYVYTNFTFEWSVINTGATNAVTVEGGADHTLVGSGTVAAGASGRFASRRTAANTFVTYRLS